MADFVSDVKSVVNSVYSYIPAILPKAKEVEQVVVKEINMVVGVPHSARAFVRLAGISGALAVSLGAYGSHVMRHEKVDPKRVEVFDIANKYHLLHSLGLLAVPLTPKPVLTGCLMAGGMILFCGTCYYHALTNDDSLRRLTPYGGFMLIFAWASMAL